MQSIGIFGGTFDPPHLGHLILASEARAEFKLDRLLWVLTPDPPHKQDRAITASSHRLAMVELALEDDPDFELSTVDLDRPGPHYAVDTVKIIGSKNTEAKLMYLMGGDSLRDLPAWHKPAEFVEACDSIGVMRRAEASIDLKALEKEFPGIAEKIHWMDSPLIDISAHDIRARAANGKPFRYFLPEKVYEYVLENGLYQTS